MKNKTNYYLNLFILAILLFSTYNELAAQELFPLKVNDKWGLYNNRGEKKNHHIKKLL